MKCALGLLLLLGQAQTDDAPLIVPQIDAAVRSIPGYNQRAEPRPVADDVFLRRVMKDLVDAAPAEVEAKAFADSTDAHKRPKKISELLADERYGKFWSRRFVEVFFGDVNRQRWTELPELPPGREAVLISHFGDWLSYQFNKDKPWTEIVGELLGARGTTEGDPALAYLLSMRRGKGYTREFAEKIPRELLGIRLACARCHDHPYDKWTMKDYYGMAGFIVRQRAKVYGDHIEAKYTNFGEMKMEAGGLPASPSFREGEEVLPQFLYGQKPGENDDRMKSLIFYMTDRTTNQLPRMLVNRTWGWLFGYGVLHPVDDFNLRNKAISPALLELLTKSVIDNGYSLKQLLRVICNTQAYQMPTPAEAPEAASFRHLAALKAGPRVYEKVQVKPPALPVAFEAPEGWTRVLARAPAKAVYLVLHKDDPKRTVELGLYEGKLDEAGYANLTGKIDSPKKSVQTLKGKDGTKIALIEVTGTNWCQPNAEGPVDYRFWVAVIDAKKPLYFRVGGAGDLLDPWRADLITLLQCLSLK
jgi:hypothetical protein